MANVKISDMTPGTTPLSGAELFEMTQSGNTVSATAADIAAAATDVRSVATGGTNASAQTVNGVAYFDGTKITTGTDLAFNGSGLSTAFGVKSSSPSAGIGYSTGAGALVTQTASRTTGVTINAMSGRITLFSAAGSTSPATFTVSNSAFAATDCPHVWQVSGVDLYTIDVTAAAAGQFNITFNTKSGTTVEQPVFGFCILKAVTA